MSSYHNEFVPDEGRVGAIPTVPAIPGPVSVEAEIQLRFGVAHTLAVVAEKLGISPRQVQSHIDDGSLVAVNVGRGAERRDLRVLDDDLEGFVVRRRTKAVTAATFVRPATAKRAGQTSAPTPGYAERRAARLSSQGGR